MGPFSRLKRKFQDNTFLMLITTLRLLAVPIGLMFFYTCFLYEDEEGRLQNRIEDVWVTINDNAKISGDKTSVLFGKVAGLVTRVFDRVLGKRLFSFQLVGVSSSAAFAALFLALGVGCLGLFYLIFLGGASLSEAVVKAVAGVFMLGLAALFIGLLCFGLAAMPSLWPSPWCVGLSLIPISLFSYGVIRLMLIHAPFDIQMEMFTAALIVSVLSDVFLLAVVRLTVRRVSAQTNAFNITTAILVQTAIIVLFVVGPFQTGLHLITKAGNKPTGPAMFAIYVAVFNAFTGISCCLFIFLLLFLLLHKSIWPIFSRLFYPLARYRVILRHGLMASIGGVCILFAVPLAWKPFVSNMMGWLK